MSEITRRIGLSLGADLCWPICYEEILKQLNPAVKAGGDTIRFEVDRVTIEPFGLRQPCRYDLVIDRLTHWYFTSREWIKKAILLDGLYVFNNPWTVQSMTKHTSYAAMMRLGLPIPETWMIPPKAYEPKTDLQVTLERYARLFTLEDVGERVGYPAFMKPYDGGGWVGINKVDNPEKLREAYDGSGTNLMHLQKAVLPHDRFVRTIGFGPQIKYIRYDADQPLHDRYTRDRDFLNPADESLLRDITLTINSFFLWDFNSCESLHQDGTWYPIDFANPCPDSQVTSLHAHFPWLVKAYLRWSLFCAATKRPMRMNPDWTPYFDSRHDGMGYREKLASYAGIAHRHFETERFAEFCANELRDLDETAWNFFGSDRAKEAVRQKTATLFPTHEVEEFTELFWTRIQAWRQTSEAHGHDAGLGTGWEAARRVEPAPAAAVLPPAAPARAAAAVPEAVRSTRPMPQAANPLPRAADKADAPPAAAARPADRKSAPKKPAAPGKTQSSATRRGGQ